MCLPPASLLACLPTYLLAPCFLVGSLVLQYLSAFGSYAAVQAASGPLQKFCGWLVQVGRRSDPQEDAAVVVAVRQAVGPSMVLRADANRAWTLEQAIEVGDDSPRSMVPNLGQLLCCLVLLFWAAALYSRCAPRGPGVGATAACWPASLCTSCAMLLTCTTPTALVCSLAGRRRLQACNTLRSQCAGQGAWGSSSPSWQSSTGAQDCQWRWTRLWTKVGRENQAFQCEGWGSQTEEHPS